MDERALRGARPGWVRVCLYIWTLPASLLGLVLLVAGGGLARGRTAIVDGVVESSGPWMRWGLRHLTLVEGGAAAITFGHVVLGRDRASLAWSRAHERVHVRQYERWGPFFIAAYVAASLYEWARGGDPYRDNRFERESRRVGDVL